MRTNGDKVATGALRTTRITLTTGSPAALERAFLERLAALRAQDPLTPIDVLIGGVLLRPYLQRLVAETSPGLVNVRFHTLGELGMQLGELQPGDLRPPAAPGDGRAGARARGGR